ncbi:hypothetical protein A2U01_0063441 [Trifolium medium]|uniref:Uncharacterized protein n=1 Tax=Trifolium medium TaxID=97028 RepID=A0A392S2U1_9FABA|nr:hypothetical protein [Trifolium medium]
MPGGNQISSAETDDDELARREINTELFINWVENGAGDLDEDFFGGFWQVRGRIRRVGGCEVMEKEILNEIIEG